MKLFNRKNTDTANSKKDNIEFIEAKACGNPFCDCGLLTMAYRKTGNEEYDLSIPLDVYEENIAGLERIEAEAEFKTSLRQYVDLLSEDDWKSLQILYVIKKNEIVKQLNVDETQFEFEFDEEDFSQPDLRFSYQDAFPCTELVYEINKKNYSVNDFYCKKIGCHCSEVLILVVEYGDANPDTFNIVGSFEYNYKTHAGIIEGDKTIVRKVIELWKEDFPDYDMMLTSRNEQVKALYKKALLKKGKLSQGSKLAGKTMLRGGAALSAPVGRNDDCPCGSGKKYKKCCLGKL